LNSYTLNILYGEEYIRRLKDVEEESNNNIKEEEEGNNNTNIDILLLDEFSIPLFPFLAYLSLRKTFACDSCSLINKLEKEEEEVLLNSEKEKNQKPFYPYGIDGFQEEKSNSEKEKENALINPLISNDVYESHCNSIDLLKRKGINICNSIISTSENVDTSTFTPVEEVSSTSSFPPSLTINLPDNDNYNSSFNSFTFNRISSQELFFVFFSIHAFIDKILNGSFICFFLKFIFIC
jgi:hypothetical protein